jgi:hypothetical protein
MAVTFDKSDINGDIAMLKGDKPTITAPPDLHIAGSAALQ